MKEEAEAAVDAVSRVPTRLLNFASIHYTRYTY